MRKLLYFTILFGFQCVNTSGQSCDYNTNIIELNSLCDIENLLIQQDATVSARDVIVLKPGFSLNSSQLNGHKFTAKIDHNIVVETANYDNIEDIPSQLQDFTGYIPVGIGGTVDVSPTGGAMYQLPIQVSPGSKGVQPNLSIVYNSQSGNGLLGYGWNLGGLSSIIRVNKNPYYDNDVDAITLTELGALMFDGVRLVKLDTSSAFYYPANNPYTKVEYADNSFTVTTQDGVVMQFGSTPNSQINAVGANQPYCWMLNRITDANGNYIDYVYYKDQALGESRISEINYTGNSLTGKVPYNSVKFYYDKRSDPSSSYVSGYNVSQNSILTAIKVFCEGSISKEYNFIYSDDFYSKLRMITLEADGVKFMPTIINWATNGTQTPVVENYGTYSLYQNQLFFGDVKEDGLTDVVRFQEFNQNGSLRRKIHINFGDGSYSSFDLPDFFVVFSNTSQLRYGANFYVNDIKVIDTDGDGKSEILVHFTMDERKEWINSQTGYVTSSNGTVTDFITSYVYNSITRQFDSNRKYSLVKCQQTNAFCGLVYLDNYKHYFVDIDNDGVCNHIIIKNKQLHSINGGVILGDASGQIGEFKNLEYVDFNGDGRVDLMFFKQNGEASIWTTKKGSLVKLYSGSITNDVNKFFPGDFNGDGKTDYIGIDNSKNWFLKYSTGQSFVDGVLPEGVNLFTETEVFVYDGYGYEGGYWETQTSIIPTASLTVDDLNNDGKSDILFLKSINGVDKLNIALNNGNSFKIIEVSNIDDSQYSSGNKYTKVFYPVDLNSDGVKDVIYGSFRYKIVNNVVYYQPYRKVTFSNGFDNHLLVESIQSGLKNKTSLTYSSFKNNRLILNDLPLIHLKGPMKVVNNVKSLYGSKIISDINYSFSDGYLHSQGAGFMGFKKVVVSNSINNSIQETEYSFSIPGVNGIYSSWPSKIIERKGSTLLSTTVNSISTLGGSVSQKCFLPIVTASIVNDHLKNITSRSAYSYNSVLGRLVNQDVTIGEWTTSISYAYDIVSGYSTRISNVTSERSNSNDSFSQTTSYSYSPEVPYRVISKTEHGITTTFNEFDSYGNVKSLTTGDRNTFLNYDSRGRFVVLSKDYAGLITKKSYRYSDGTVITETDPNEFSTKKTIIASNGNIITKKHLPDGNVETNTLTWDNSGDWDFCNQESVTNGNTIKTYYNLVGQKVKETTKGYRGLEHFVEYEYDLQGRLISQTSDAVSTPTTYAYDDLDRAKSISGHNGLSISYEYGRDFVKTTSSITGVETKYYDVLGNVIKVIAPTGVIEYKYLASGKVKEVNAEGAKTEMSYDSRGNQLTLKDPDAGLTTYTYNIFNELISQTDAVGQTITVNYENGRVKSRTGDGISELYNYYTSAGKLGLLESVNRNGIIESYQYDDLARVTSVVTVGEGKSFTTFHEYNSRGQLEYTTYPTGLKVKYEYDVVGNIEKIYDNSNLASPIWFGESKNKLEQWVKFSLGNGLVTSYQYDPTTLMLSNIKTGTNASPSSIQNLSFLFNSKGQLENRTQGSLFESFEYDELNRLVRSQVSGQLPMEINYVSNGNISSTSFAGNYTYLSAKPHAVESVAGQTALGQSPKLITNCTYTSDNLIREMDNGSYKNIFSYGPSGNRFRVDHYQGNSLVRSKIYVENNEFLLDNGGNIVTSRTFIYAPTGICAVYEKTGSASAEFHYVHTDYLGSWLVITNKTGDIENEYSYDAWGRPRDPNTWIIKDISITNALANLDAMQPRFDRGYTGHEHMCGFGLINMNGRLFDPYLQRFLSPDDYVQSPFNAQSYNRYGYCVNNPLMFTDPSGQYFWLIIGGYIAITQAMKAGADASNNGGKFWEGFGRSLAISAVSMVIGYGAGALIGAFMPSASVMFANQSSALLYGAIGGALSGGISGGLTNMLFGGSFKQGFLSGFIMGGIMGGIGGVNQFNKMYDEFLKIYSGPMETNSTGSLTPSNSTLSEFSEKYFSDFLYSDKANLIYEEGYVKGKNPDASAFMDPTPVNGKYNIYFSESSFSSKWSLYLDMGHEYVHLSNFLEGYTNRAYSEIAAYTWNYRVSNNRWYLDFSYNKYFNPDASIANRGIYNNVIKQHYMRYGHWKLWTRIPSGLL